MIVTKIFNFRQTRPGKVSTAFENDFYPFESNKSPSLQDKEPSKKSEEANIDFKELSELSSILLKDEQILLNKTGKHLNENLQWPITTTREKHEDNDVYLARANNPFGHSTKWKYK